MMVCVVWSMDVMIGYGVICILDECVCCVKEVDGYEVLICMLGVFECFDIDIECGMLWVMLKSVFGVDDVYIDVDFSVVWWDEDSVFDGVVCIGLRVCVIGEARRVGDEVLFEICVCVVCVMDGLDMCVYGKVLEICWKFLGEMLL